MSYRFESSAWFPRPTAEVREFFSNVENLNQLTPNFFQLNLEEAELGVPLYVDQRFRYRFRLFGIPFRWVTHIKEVGEDHFVDIQERGPYRSFRHLHLFVEYRGGTLMVDRIDYELGYGPLSFLVNGLAVRPMLASIFGYRRVEAQRSLGGFDLDDLGNCGAGG